MLISNINSHLIIFASLNQYSFDLLPSLFGCCSFNQVRSSSCRHYETETVNDEATSGYRNRPTQVAAAIHLMTTDPPVNRLAWVASQAT